MVVTSGDTAAMGSGIMMSPSRLYSKPEASRDGEFRCDILEL